MTHSIVLEETFISLAMIGVAIFTIEESSDVIKVNSAIVSKAMIRLLFIISFLSYFLKALNKDSVYVYNCQLNKEDKFLNL